MIGSNGVYIWMRPCIALNSSSLCFLVFASSSETIASINGWTKVFFEISDMSTLWVKQMASVTTTKKGSCYKIIFGYENEIERIPEPRSLVKKSLIFSLSLLVDQARENSGGMVALACVDCP